MGFGRFFFDENFAQGLPPGTTSWPQAGVSDYDAGTIIEDGISFGWTPDPVSSWIEYLCWIECYLDPGLVVHKPLPQSASLVGQRALRTFNPPAGNAQGTLVNARAQGVDTLATATIADSDLDSNTRGVNTVCVTQFTDYVQRMATATYWFFLTGHALRAGYQVPIPSMISVAGAQAIPATPNGDAPQYAFNRVVANYSGVPVFMARWGLWYTVAVPPTANQVPPPNVAQHIRGDAVLPSSVQVPFSIPDTNAVQTRILRGGP